VDHKTDLNIKSTTYKSITLSLYGHLLYSSTGRSVLKLEVLNFAHMGLCIS